MQVVSRPDRAVWKKICINFETQGTLPGACVVFLPCFCDKLPWLRTWGVLMAHYTMYVAAYLKNLLNILLVDYQAFLPAILLAIAVLLVVIGLFKLPKV